MNIAKIALAAIAMTFTGVATMAPATPAYAQSSSGVPAQLIQAAKAGIIDKDYEEIFGEKISGTFAATRIMQTPYYIVYFKTNNNCGTGGCVAQIWKNENGRFVQKESLPVSFLPIVLLPHLDNGMPRLGVSSSMADGRPAILPVAFDGENYTNTMGDRMLTPTSGKPILANSMLRPL